MALDAEKLKGELKERIHSALMREFPEVTAVPGYQGQVDAYWVKLAAAISDVAIDIVNDIQNDAEVMAGIATSDLAVTIAPGKIQ